VELTRWPRRRKKQRRTHRPGDPRVCVRPRSRDMHAEREELVKRVFPELRKLCEGARGNLGRGGSAAGHPGRAPRPRAGAAPFAWPRSRTAARTSSGFWGERYGWCRARMSGDLIQAQSWLKEHVQEGKSVTELEIPAWGSQRSARWPRTVLLLPGSGCSSGAGGGLDEEEVKELGPVEPGRRAEAAQV